jgi:hypothetical protein
MNNQIFRPALKSKLPRSLGCRCGKFHINHPITQPMQYWPRKIITCTQGHAGPLALQVDLLPFLGRCVNCQHTPLSFTEMEGVGKSCPFQDLNQLFMFP